MAGEVPMKTICVLTATRAEYGLLKRLILRLDADPDFRIKTVVTGMHLSPEFGNTYQEIEADGIIIDEKISILTDTDGPAAVSLEMGQALIAFGAYFEKTRPDLLVVLGDRYETLAVCLAAVNQRIPIAHLHGGEKTEGALDDVYRHAITKLSFLHFPCAEEYRQRIIQMGEDPERVYNVGAMSTENILNQELLSKNELEESISFSLGDSYGVVTFHPVTLEENTALDQVRELLATLVEISDMKYIITKANADQGGRSVNQLLDEFAATHREQFCVVESLGMKRYLSALKYASMVIGNSSSGLLEAPVFQIPTVNIGDRQKGRLRATSVIDCAPEKSAIHSAIQQAKNPDFLKEIRKEKKLYGDGTTSEQIIEVLKKYLLDGEINLKKTFYDMI